MNRRERRCMISRILIVPRNLANNNLFQIKKNIRRKGKTVKRGERKEKKNKQIYIKKKTCC